MPTTHPSFCRMCHAGCPILVDIEDGVPVKIAGDPSNDLFNGYTCVKGRQLPEQHTHPDRLLHSQKRQPDGTFRPIPVEQAMDEIAEILQRLLAEHGPLSVITYTGTYSLANMGTAPLQNAFSAAIGNPRNFGAISIDQPGKTIAQGLTGVWMGPGQNPADADVSLIVGANPLVSISGGLAQANPRKWLHDAKQRGFKLIVIDPRRTETASQADIHIQPRPGQDIAIVAGILRIILDENLYDAEFVANEVSGVDALRKAVAPFTPSEVAARADINADDLIAAARMFAAGPRGLAAAGVGPNFASAAGTLFEYLLSSINILCGRFLRPGDPVWNPGTLVESVPRKAQALPPFPSYGYGVPLRVRGLADTLVGPSTAAIADEILLPGEGQIRALISVGGNPVAAWPDQTKVRKAMETIDLLVQIDPWMSATSKMAHYVIAPTLSFEVAGMSNYLDMLAPYAPGFGMPRPWGQYAPQLIDPPAGSDVIPEWEFFFGLAQRMGLQLDIRPVDFSGPTGETFPIDMTKKPTGDELLEILARKARVPLSEVKRHPNGAVFDDPSIVVLPKDEGWEGRFDLGNELMLRDLGVIVETGAVDMASWANADFPFRLISRRTNSRYNSGGHTLTKLQQADPYNPAYMHLDDMNALELTPGDVIEIASGRATILGVVQPDDTLRRGLVSMSHSWGDLSEYDEDVRKIGGPISRLLSVDDAYDPYSGQPVMSNVPIAVRPHERVDTESSKAGAATS